MAELLFREDPYLKRCEATVLAVRDNVVELDRTVFYPLGGGQAGDTGQIRGPFGAARVIDTRKGATGDAVLHLLEPGTSLQPGTRDEMQIDW